MRVAVYILLTVLLCACSSKPDAPATPAVEPTAIPRIGVVGYVQQQTERAIDQTNWKTAILGVINNTSKADQEATIARTTYDVTVFFDAGQQETIKLDQDPQLKPGQRVRVTGKKFEVLPR